MNKEKLLGNKWFLAIILFLSGFLGNTLESFGHLFEINITINIIAGLLLGIFYTKTMHTKMPSNLKGVTVLISAGLLTIYLRGEDYLSNPELFHLVFKNLGFLGLLLFLGSTFGMYVLTQYILLTLGSNLYILKTKSN